MNEININRTDGITIKGTEEVVIAGIITLGFLAYTYIKDVASKKKLEENNEKK